MRETNNSFYQSNTNSKVRASVLHKVYTTILNWPLPEEQIPMSNISVNTSGSDGGAITAEI